MQDYSLGLALFDYIPVLLSAFGLYLLADLLAQNSKGARLAVMLGVALVAAGGLSKATWKLTWVLTQNDVSLLNNLLFILMAPGMIVLASHALAGPGKGRPTPRAVILSLLLLGLAAGLASLKPDSRAWFFTLLGAASLANITISITLIRQSWQRQEWLSAGIFMFSILLILSLSGLSRISAGSAPLQWLAEILNTLAHGSFALAIWRLRRVILSTPDNVSKPSPG